MVVDPICMMKFSPREAQTTAIHQGRLYYFCSPVCQERFLQAPEEHAPNVTAMQLTVGVMGSAAEQIPESIGGKVTALGQCIASHEFILITGACPGLPYKCAQGAFHDGGTSIGISPALSLDEHLLKYRSPADVYQVIIYTGSGLMGREVTNIRSSDMVVIVGGRSGTLGEFAIAYDEGKLIGILEGTGGITDHIPEIVSSFKKNSGARLIYSSDPSELIQEMAKTYSQHHFHRPSCFCAASA